jgi:hypothetical protein
MTAGGSIVDHLLGSYRRSFEAVCSGQLDPLKQFRGGREGLLALTQAIPLDVVLQCEGLALEEVQVSASRSVVGPCINASRWSVCLSSALLSVLLPVCLPCRHGTVCFFWQCLSLHH